MASEIRWSIGPLNKRKARCIVEMSMESMDTLRVSVEHDATAKPSSAI